MVLPQRSGTKRDVVVSVHVHEEASAVTEFWGKKSEQPRVTLKEI